MSRNFGAETGTFIFTTTFPLYQATQSDGSINTVGLSTLTIGIVFYLASLFGENTSAGRAFRSIQEDQLELFRQIEANIAATGMDGHACVLRFICEMQTNKFSHSSIIGEILSLIFTPKPGGEHTLLKDYISAEMVGQERVEGRFEGVDETCGQRYYTCPVSVFNALRRFTSTYSTPADKPLNTTTHMQGHSQDDDH